MNDGNHVFTGICYKTLTRKVLKEAAEEYKEEKKCNLFAKYLFYSDFY